jgi:hypothetical protein
MRKTAEKLQMDMNGLIDSKVATLSNKICYEKAYLVVTTTTRVV